MNKRILKRAFSVLMIMSCVFTMTACQKKKEKADTGKYTSTEVSDVIVKSMTDLPEMNTDKSGDSKAEHIFAVLSDIEYDRIEDFTYLRAKEDNNLAEEIAVIRVKDKNDLAIVKKGLEERVTHRKDYFVQYNKPDEVTKVENAVITVKGNYAVMIIGNQAGNGKYEFEKFLDK